MAAANAAVVFAAHGDRVNAALRVVCPANGYVEDALAAPRFACSARVRLVMRST